MDEEARVVAAEKRHNARRFALDIRRYGRREITPAPLPTREPVKFPAPSRYEERNGG